MFGILCVCTVQSLNTCWIELSCTTTVVDCMIVFAFMFEDINTLPSMNVIYISLGSVGSMC